MPYHQWNLLVVGPGGYRQRDFLRVGGAVSIVVALTALIALALLPDG